MANYYTESSFIVKCSQVEAQKLINTLAFSRKVSSSGIFEEDDGLSLLLQHKNDSFPLGLDQGQKNLLKDINDGGVDIMGNESFGFKVEIDAAGLWFHHDESIDIDAATNCVESFLQNFDVKDQIVEISASYRCSRPTLEAFSGSTVFVTKHFTESVSKSGTELAVSKAFKENVEYAFCEIIENNAEAVHSQHFLIKAERGSDMNDVASKILINFRGNEEDNEMDEDGNVDFGDNMMGYVNDVRSLTNHDFHIMSQYLPTLTK
jgi:hypothetical protein